MFITNPFSALTEYIPASAMQLFLVLMIVFVVGGTILDLLHKKSAKYFFEHSEKQKKSATIEVSSAAKKSLLIKTISSEVLTSSEFSNQKRRLSHLLTMYGFILFAATTAIMIFGYAGATDTPAIFPILWHIGALMLAVGGYWFWFAIRVDVAAEGKKWYDIAPKADMFILSLLATSTFALLWSFTGSMVFLVLFAISMIALFGGVYWSKFAHMFFKPAAAYQKKVAWADGSREGLPDMPDLSSAEVHEKYPDIPTYMGKTPPDMGAGIRREPANHY
ncbi:MAG: hypothetical protein V3U78_00360 [Thiotrichaceae bacterium]